MGEDGGMQDKPDDYEPIIAPRRSREALREDAPPLWRVVLALLVGLVVVVSLAWWWMGRSSHEDSSSARSEGAAAEVDQEVLPETHVEEELVPPARDADRPVEAPQQSAPPPPAAEPEVDAAEEAPVPEPIPVVVLEGIPAEESEPPAPPPSVSVRFASTDPQVRFELRNSSDSSLVLTSTVGDVVSVTPGTYRIVASGAGLEKLEQEVTFDGERPLEYTVELCAQRKYERESLAGQVVEERACSSTPECESMFMILSEYADELVRDRAFRTQLCAKWRSNATPDGSWTLNVGCDGAVPATTCRIEIEQGACAHAQPRRNARGGACPRVELK